MQKNSLMILAALLLSTNAYSQSFRIEPGAKVLNGNPLSVKLDGLPGNAEITIAAERPIADYVSPKRMIYRAEATFRTGADGKLDLATAAPQKGSYKQADGYGLLWSMSPTTAEAPADWKSGEVRYSARVGDKDIATARLEILSSLPEVQTEKVEQFPGAVFATLPAKESRPALILLGGSEGGSLITRSAGLWASQGFAVLALPYYSPARWPSNKPELPALPSAFADIPIERLNAARDWLANRHGVDASRIAIHGISKGAEFALLAAVHLPWVSAVVAVVPTDVVWEGWGDGVEPAKRASFAFNGKPFPFVPYQDFAEEFAGFQTGRPVHIRRPQDKGRAAHPAAAVAARIPIERFAKPLMVIGAQDDQVWASGMMAHNIAERRAEAKVPTVSLIYTDAGHFIGDTGFGPTTQYNSYPSKSGGTPEGNAFAQLDAWPKQVAFLKSALGLK